MAFFLANLVESRPKSHFPYNPADPSSRSLTLPDGVALATGDVAPVPL